MGQHAEQWDLVIKVKHGDALRRIGVHVQGKLMDYDMNKLRAKICSLFNLSLNTDFILTYADVDGDTVTLDNDDELFDAVISQHLNPLRITVELKSKPDILSAESPQSETMPVTNVQSEPVIDPLMTVLSNLFNVTDKAISNSPASDVIKSEPFKNVLNNIRKDVKEATSFSPAISNLVDQLSRVGLSSVNQIEPVCESSSKMPPTTVVPTNPPDLNLPYESQPWDFPTKVANETVDSVTKWSDPACPVDAPRPLYPLEELLVAAAQKYPDSCGGKESGSSDVHGKNTTVTICPCVLEQSYGYPQTYPSYTPAKSNDKITLNETQTSSEPPIHPNIPINREDGSLLSPTHPYQRSHSYKENLFHRGVQCDGCGMFPIEGPRFKSKVKEDYDLCNACYNQISSRKERKMDYIRSDPPCFGPRPIFKGMRGHHHRPHFPSRNMLRSCNAVKPQWNKLDSQFITDVTVSDGTVMSPLTSFTKIWRLRNNGTATWPFGTQLVWVDGDRLEQRTSATWPFRTQLVWVDGDRLGQRTSASLEIPLTGFHSGNELDIAVDFTAPARPGSYISYWTLQSPNMQKFGQRVWIHIQVFDSRPNSAASTSLNPGLDLNLPAEINTRNAPASNNINTEVSIDINPDILDNNFPKKSDMGTNQVTTAQSANIISGTTVAESTGNVPIRPEEQQPAVVDYNLVDLATNKEVKNSAADAPASDTDNNNLVESLLNELQEMGFLQTDLNKEVLSRNGYDLEQSVEDLCDFAEWDPLLSELHEMGFKDRVLNKKMLEKNGGSIKRAVLDLIAGKNE